MQALRLASRSALRAKIERGTLCIYQGDCLVHRSKAQLGHPDWEHVTLREVALYGIEMLRLGLGNFQLDLARSQDAQAALWIGRHWIAQGPPNWQWFVQTLSEICKHCALRRAGACALGSPTECCA